MPIAPIIWTGWLNDSKPMPAALLPYVESQKLPGYEHRFITLVSPEWAQALSESRYLRECAGAKNWVKAIDYFRFWLVYKYSGIWLDTDMEVLPGKNFDDLLHNRAFIAWEFNGFIANSSFGAEAGHPLWKKYMDRVERNFRGDGDLIFFVGMRCLTDCWWGEDFAGRHGVEVLSAEVFYPWNHMTGVTEVTPLTRVFHHFAKNWEPTEWKTV